MELVEMVKCKNETGQKIMPIFYDVAPREVRQQTNDFGKAFDALIEKNKFDDETVEKWKDALNQVGKLKGWDLTSMPNRREGEFAKDITRSMLTELKKTHLEESDCVVGVDSKVEEIMRSIGTHPDGTTIIGIHGMGGIGKTTLAKIVYNQICHNFRNCCYLANIREVSYRKGIEQLQSQLISDVLRIKLQDIRNEDEGIKMIKARLSSKKVLLLLDDVDRKNQLNALIGERNWYGKGSCIIITTRHQKVLGVLEVDRSYELKSLEFDHSLQLFSKHAFREDHPPEEYTAESRKAVKISGGLPLALEVIGSFLYGNQKKFWDHALKKLEKIPHQDVREKLMISFEALDDQQRNIFLDIACLFIGFDRNIATYMWDSCEFFPEEAIEVLLQMSLIKIREENQLWMHDQLRDLGQEIVRQRSRDKSEEQSRIWDHVQAFDVLRSGKETRNIEAMCLKFDHQSQHFFTGEEFVSLPNLRFLHIESKRLEGIASYKFIMKKSLILPKLRWLSWHNIPQAFTLVTFSLVELVILDLSESEITENWDGWNYIKIAMNLKVLNLTRCLKLKRTPDFSNHIKVERLILEGCESLTQIDGSIGQLTNLALLNVNYCHKLHGLPDELGKLEVLTELLIEGTSIRDIPEWTRMKKLEILNAGGCQLLRPPSFIGYFTSLTKLLLVATRFAQLPDSIGQLVSLIELDLSYAHITELPYSMEKMKNLRVLRLTHSCLERLPTFIGMLEKLEEIDGRECSMLKGIIPSDIVNLSFLRILKLTGTNISYARKLPVNLNTLWLDTGSMVALNDCSNLSNLKDLDLSLYKNNGYKLLTDPSPWWIGRICKLEWLCLESPHFTTISANIILLSQLKRLQLCCSKLRCLPQLPQSLTYLCIIYCAKLSASIDLSNLVALEELVVENCGKIKEIRCNECLENLRILNLTGVTSLEKLPDLTKLKQLKELILWDCTNVFELRGTSESLERINLRHCFYLEKLPGPSSFKNLKQLCTYGCDRLSNFLERSDCWRKWILGAKHLSGVANFEKGPLPEEEDLELELGRLELELLVMERLEEDKWLELKRIQDDERLELEQLEDRWLKWGKSFAQAESTMLELLRQDGQLARQWVEQGKQLARERLEQLERRKQLARERLERLEQGKQIEWNWLEQIEWNWLEQIVWHEQLRQKRLKRGEQLRRKRLKRDEQLRPEQLEQLMLEWLEQLERLELEQLERLKRLEQLERRKQLTQERLEQLDQSKQFTQEQLVQHTRECLMQDKRRGGFESSSTSAQAQKARARGARARAREHAQARARKVSNVIKSASSVY